MRIIYNICFPVCFFFFFLQGGTLSYVAPEVHRGADIDEKCDVYALAIVLWELVTLQVC
jgi:serine/threonine protein kinase